MLALLPLLTLAAAAPLQSRWACNGDDCSLAALAEQSGKLYVGNAWQSFYFAEPRYEPILAREFNQYTPENEMKWELVQPERGVYNWTGSDLVSDWLLETWPN